LTRNTEAISSIIFFANNISGQGWWRIKGVDNIYSVKRKNIHFFVYFPTSVFRKLLLLKTTNHTNMRNATSAAFRPITIAIADPHSIFLEGLQAIFKRQSQMKIVGEAKNGKQLLDVVERSKPDIVLTEIKMPLITGVEVTQQLKGKFPQLQVIAVTDREEGHYIIDMLEAGAKGYLLKDSPSNELFKAVKTVHSGDPYYCTRTSSKLVQLMVTRKFNPYKPEKKPLFNEKEIAVIRLICEEYASKEIAERIFTTAKYVDRLRERIEEKIGAKNIAGIVVYAVRNRIYSIE
jgi:DNA-binding NarL/FixJ family response regulator